MRPNAKPRLVLALLAAAALALSCAVAASAQTTTTTTTTTTTSTTTTTPAGPPGSVQGVPPAGIATLLPDGRAVPPAGAPLGVQNVIRAGNRIHKRPYIWGGGHRRWKSKGYDCSGAVSYVLHAAGLLSRPLVSGSLASSWGYPGTGNWITVYANRGHVYAVIAGLRFDTSPGADTWNQGRGPRWRTTLRSPAGYAAKYYPGY